MKRKIVASQAMLLNIPIDLKRRIAKQADREHIPMARYIRRILDEATHALSVDKPNTYASGIGFEQ